MKRIIVTAIAAVLVTLVAHLQAQQVTSEELNGVRNFKRLETTVACAGATSAQAMPAIKKMGFASVVNLRLAVGPGRIESKAIANR